MLNRIHEIITEGLNVPGCSKYFVSPFVRYCPLTDLHLCFAIVIDIKPCMPCCCLTPNGAMPWSKYGPVRERASGSVVVLAAASLTARDRSLTTATLVSHPGVGCVAPKYEQCSDHDVLVAYGIRGFR